jgi:hypothetical protein
MRFPTLTDSIGYQTLVVEDAHGAQDHGFTDGDAVLFDETLGAAGNATKVPARVFTDVVRNIKYGCREGTGERGPESDAVDDDPYELASSINRAASPLWGSASFVASGLEFTTSTLNLNVVLSAGVFVFEGRKYHATADRLEDVIVEVDGSEAGNGDAFTLLASRDHYVSIGPATDATLSITVQDVANGAGAPVVPDGEFYVAVIVTNGTGVPLGGVTYPYLGKIIAGADSGQLRLRDTGSGTALEPYDFNLGATLGSLASFDATEALGGNFWANVYTEEIHIRSYTTAGRVGDCTRFFTRECETSGNVTATMDVLDLDNYPNASVIEIQVTVVGYSTTNSHVYTRSFARMARRNNAGSMGLVGSLVETRTEEDTGALSLASTLIASAEGDNSLVQIQVTGAAANDIEWTASIKTIEKRGNS